MTHVQIHCKTQSRNVNEMDQPSWFSLRGGSDHFGLVQVASLRADTTTVLELVRSCVSHAVEADDRRSLPRRLMGVPAACITLAMNPKERRVCELSIMQCHAKQTEGKHCSALAGNMVGARNG